MRIVSIRPAAQIAHILVQIAFEFLQRKPVNITFEFHHGFKLDPVIAPAPGIKFGVIGRPQADIAITPGQPQQEPYLLLSAILALAVTPHPMAGNVVAQPVACAPKNAHMFRLEPDFFSKLTKHRLLRRFPGLDATLGKLPGVLIDALGPEHLVLGVAQYDADVGAVAVTVDHRRHLFKNPSLITLFHTTQKLQPDMSLSFNRLIALSLLISTGLLAACSNMMPSDRAVFIFPGAHEFGSTAVAFSPSGTHVVSGGHQGNVKLWDIRKHKLLAEAKPHESVVRAIAVASQSLFATGSDDGRIVIWNNGKILSQPTSTLVTSLVWFQGKLVSGHNDKFLRVWDKNLKEIQKLELDDGIEGLAVNGKQLAVALSDRIILMGPDFKAKNMLDTGGVTPHDMQFSPDGKRLAAGGWFRLHVWDLSSGQHQSIPTEHGGLLTSVSFSPDGKHIVSLGRHTDSAIRIMDTQEFNVERRYQAHELCGAMIRYSPDGRWLVSASDDESIRLYDLSLPYQPRRGLNDVSEPPTAPVPAARSSSPTVQ